LLITFAEGGSQSQSKPFPDETNKFQFDQVVSVRLGKRSRQLHCAHATEFHDLKGRSLALDFE